MIAKRMWTNVTLDCSTISYKYIYAGVCVCVCTSAWALSQNMATKSVMNATLTEYQHQQQQPQLVRRIKRRAQRKKRAKASSYTIIWLCAQVDMQSPISVLEFHNNVQRTAGGTLCNACVYVSCSSAKCWFNCTSRNLCYCTQKLNAPNGDTGSN